MDISQYDIVIKKHVFERAMQREIHPDMIEDTLLKRKIKKFGKHGVKFINKGSKRTLICVGELTGNRLNILTIEEGN